MLHPRSIAILAATALAATLNRPLAAQQPQRAPGLEVHGVVRDAVSGAPVRGAVVELLDVRRKAATDSSGEIGAPLGTYLGIDFAQPNGTVAFGGLFIPFDSAKLNSLYPSHGTYVQRVAKAAHRLVERREILKEDAKAYIEEATHSTIGK